MPLPETPELIEALVRARLPSNESDLLIRSIIGVFARPEARARGLLRADLEALLSLLRPDKRTPMRAAPPAPRPPGKIGTAEPPPPRAP
ncbi:hypothetical protein KM176_11160 [Pseudooceanicola sp. CBS1P-1]|uniref:Uncharacterized protein n=1 Tax=Pseudooceanicola albus TaxID=2692189 RepID=A0A6L7G9B9_9RHOB|nr:MULTISPECIES: hypothetical protein [Pseudooceanicola]MBT9384418.1 hypothetical protein [Pseudooceanicola endophyticus]MXN20681.1 hypothetical protein [Pseudooceanicola albus]